MAAVPSIGRATRVEAPARAQHAAATEGLYERHAAKILSYCLHQLGSREEAEDAVQTTFMNAFRALGRGVVPEAESAWLFKIAENVCLSRRRSSWRRGRIESPSDFEVIEEIVPGPSRQRDELIGIEDALASMPEQQRRAILLREWQGLSYREIADELEVSQSAVETLIFRARRSLAQGLEQPELAKGPRRKGFRRALHILDVGTLLAAAKTLLAGSAAVQATAAAVAVTAVAGTTAATVKNEGHSPQPATMPPAAVEKAPPVRRAAPAPVAPAPAAEGAAPSPALVPRARPAVLAPRRQQLRAKATAPKAVAPKAVASRPASAPAAPVAAPAPAATAPAPPVADVTAPAAPAAPVPPAATPEPPAPPAPQPPAASKPAAPKHEPRAEEKARQREQRREQREERRNRGRDVAAQPEPQPAPVVAPAPVVDAPVPAEPKPGHPWPRELAALPVDPAALVEAAMSAEPAPDADPAAAPADGAEEERTRGHRRGRRG